MSSSLLKRIYCVDSLRCECAQKVNRKVMLYS